MTQKEKDVQALRKFLDIFYNEKYQNPVDIFEKKLMDSILYFYDAVKFIKKGKHICKRSR